MHGHVQLKNMIQSKKTSNTINKWSKRFFDLPEQNQGFRTIFAHFLGDCKLKIFKTREASAYYVTILLFGNVSHISYLFSLFYPAQWLRVSNHWFQLNGFSMPLLFQEKFSVNTDSNRNTISSTRVCSANRWLERESNWFCAHFFQHAVDSRFTDFYIPRNWEETQQITLFRSLTLRKCFLKSIFFWLSLVATRTRRLKNYTRTTQIELLTSI